ncbi:hypothetical protein G7Y89_g11949 [Cudoniella acicularis]|uniref:Alcohol dehydrogenase-like N-terminal domain-containing protein n=1 Tax=Cudoniella acicularis TaxID=354080 RepID=A0A8H4RB10_9HELO|nr:hypothetical protein G7Y89_g11949 [Cudoniella acicularis]
MGLLDDVALGCAVALHASDYSTTLSSCSDSDSDSDSDSCFSEDDDEWSGASGTHDPDISANRAFTCEDPITATSRQPERLFRSFLERMKNDVLEGIMREFWVIFNHEWTTNSKKCGGGSPDSTTSSFSHGKTTTATSQSLRKHGRKEDDGDIPHNDGDRDPKRQRLGRIHRHPSKRDLCLLAPTANMILAYIVIQPESGDHCQRCKLFFNKQEDLELHHQRLEACEFAPDELAEGIPIGGSIQNRIRDRKKAYLGQTEEGKWQEIYRILFPIEEIPSPYFQTAQDDPVQSPDAAELAEYEDFSRRQLPCYVSNALQVIFREEAQPIEDRLRSRYELFLSYGNDIRAPPSMTSEEYTSVPFADTSHAAAKNASDSGYVSNCSPSRFDIPEKFTANATVNVASENLQSQTFSEWQQSQSLSAVLEQDRELTPDIFNPSLADSQSNCTAERLDFTKLFQESSSIEEWAYSEYLIPVNSHQYSNKAAVPIVATIVMKEAGRCLRKKVNTESGTRDFLGEPEIECCISIQPDLVELGICWDAHGTHFTLGHENIGIVLHIGANVTTVKVGDRVIVSDIENRAENNGESVAEVIFGIADTADLPGYAALQGGQAGYMLIPKAVSNLLKLPSGKELQLDYILLADIFPTAWSGLEFAGQIIGDTVVVFGAGPVGLLCAYSALLRGAIRVYNIDNVPSRLVKAESIGAIPINFDFGPANAQILKREPNGVDRAVDCVVVECVDDNGHNVENLPHTGY